MLVFLTALQVVFGELVPKSLALQSPVPVALYTFIPLRWRRTLHLVRRTVRQVAAFPSLPRTGDARKSAAAKP